MTEEVRVRFAPSPTGALHIGGAHTALFNWLWAKRTGGKFVLRIEDTDRERSTAEYEKTILEGLKWLGLDWDEGPDVGGPYGPYRQSERLDTYGRYAEELIEKGLAYREDGAVLFRIPTGEKVEFNDAVYGPISVMSDHVSVNKDGSIKDMVIIKSDGMPTYNYAVVVDDHCMGINWVIRGEDHVINTPKQILLYRALGWQVPNFAHLPMILGKDKKKLSKRHGATSVFEYHGLGYIPEGVFNFLALLGWSPGADREIITRHEAAKVFDITKVTKRAAVFDMDKLNHVNQEHLKRLDPMERLRLVRPFWIEMGLDPSGHGEEYLARTVTLLTSRGKTTRELAEYTDYFVDFRCVLDRYDGSDLTEETKARLRPFFQEMLRCEPWSASAMEALARSFGESNAVSLKDVAMPLRFVLSGRRVSPGVFEIAELLGPEECRRRLSHFGLL
ncbi:glutamyl-tRNA synthetase [Thermanaerovibrio acidaminovorans DSM 6589]|uniref:Glutamate--tRNA ligase n=1 Tax=Thermanaerovibrio acidaminovorans (strain ATCC 49978 / DSM 6589 / Su883) TaxID=525903 RepID=D1B5M1_THEAS|nr:glutamate--tRNA ligase [Thermanaerovibrio acidaminovorans]ACZ19312.1 glutamyl-tRNA synthetase [Thermanaerovibrio acidaminovorans DSM 6589]